MLDKDVGKLISVKFSQFSKQYIPIDVIDFERKLVLMMKILRNNKC
jgi:hypothetical protein